MVTSISIAAAAAIIGAVFYYVRKAGADSVSAATLKESNDAKDAMLEIAASDARDPTAIDRELRAGDF